MLLESRIPRFKVTTTRRNVSRVLIIAGNSLTVIGLGVLSGAFLGLVPLEPFASGLSSGLREIAMIPLTGCLFSACGYGITEFFD